MDIPEWRGHLARNEYYDHTVIMISWLIFEKADVSYKVKFFVSAYANPPNNIQQKQT